MAERPYLKEISEALGLETPSSPFSIFAHEEGTLWLLPAAEDLASELQRHSFLANNLATYLGQGRRGCYSLELSRKVVVKPKSALLMGYRGVGLTEDDKRRLCPLNEILCALRAAKCMEGNSNVVVESPIGIFNSREGKSWVIFDFLQGRQILNGEIVEENILALINDTIAKLKAYGLRPLETNPVQFLRCGANGIGMTDFEAYKPVC